MEVQVLLRQAQMAAEGVRQQALRRMVQLRPMQQGRQRRPVAVMAALVRQACKAMARMEFRLVALVAAANEHRQALEQEALAQLAALGFHTSHRIR